MKKTHPCEKDFEEKVIIRKTNPIDVAKSWNKTQTTTPYVVTNVESPHNLHMTSQCSHHKLFTHMILTLKIQLGALKH